MAAVTSKIQWNRIESPIPMSSAFSPQRLNPLDLQCSKYKQEITSFHSMVKSQGLETENSIFPSTMDFSNPIK